VRGIRIGSMARILRSRSKVNEISVLSSRDCRILAQRAASASGIWK
jgi:hypothetical protein